jgi:hypothetical protein
MRDMGPWWWSEATRPPDLSRRQPTQIPAAGGYWGLELEGVNNR